MFLTRPPRKVPEGTPVRLACIRHAASVDPEPGSNSPPLRHTLQTDGCPARSCCHHPAFQGFRLHGPSSVSDFHLVCWLPAHEIRRGPTYPQVAPVRPIVVSMSLVRKHHLFSAFHCCQPKATAPSSAPRSSPGHPIRSHNQARRVSTSYPLMPPDQLPGPSAYLSRCRPAPQGKKIALHRCRAEIATPGLNRSCSTSLV